MRKSDSGVIGWVFVCTLVLTLFSAWVTHVVVCIKTASWGFLIAGAIAFPVAWVHGIGYWLGVW